MKLLGSEWAGGRVEKYWLHSGPDGRDRITVETVQDVQPIMDAVHVQRSMPQGKDLRWKATIPNTVFEETCRITAQVWGVEPSVVFKEIMDARTDRAQQVMRTLTEGRDYRKFQAKD